MMKLNHTRSLLAAMLALVMLLAAGCSSAPAAQPTAAPTAQPTATAQPAPTVDPAEKTTRSGFYFNTVVTITLYGAPEGLMDQLLLACGKYENLLSRTIATSDVSRINASQGKTITVDPETWDILRRAKEISSLTEGAFSVTIAPMSTQWDFVNGTNRMPTESERLAVIDLVDDEKLILGEGNTVTLPAGMEIDLGGIAKGYIADKLAEMVRGKVTGAMLNFGGNVYVVGTKPDGSGFRVGVANPDKTSADAHSAIVTVTDRTVVTSGTYERYFYVDDVKYHHILDRTTGLPAVTDLDGVTIVSTSSMDADAFATACVVMGREKALAMLEQNKIDALLVDSNGYVYLTAGLEDQYPVTVIGKPGK